jgi:putative hydrolase of the HAD superfamily
MVILFDLDETLVNQKDAADVASQIFLHEFKEQLPYNETTFQKIWWEVMQKYATLFSEGKISFQEQRRLRIREIFNQPKINDEEADRRFANYLEHYEDNWQLFGDVIPCLDSLDRYTLGIVTNGNVVQQRQKLERFGLEKYFERVLISEELGYCKPHREIFLAASSQFGCDPTNCIFVGDSLENDIIGGNRAGMQGIWLNRDGRRCNDTSVLTIHGLGELKTMIESIMF